MAGYKVIGSEYMFCVNCGKEHNVEIREEETVLQNYGNPIPYVERYYYCPDLPEIHDPDECEKYCSGAMMDLNLKRIRESAKKLKIPLPNPNRQKNK